MLEAQRLTDEQQAVVAHTDGAALVFAVAGAGKTTAMVHRMARLVRDQVVPPNRILATSFGRANVQDLKLALRPFPHTAQIDTRTLHSLGRDIIKQAQKMGAARHLRLDRQSQGHGSPEQRLLTQAIAQARKQNVPYKPELDGLDRQDFLDYVGACKGNLLYANYKRLDLPHEIKRKAGQAPDPSPQLTWYLDLYQLFEEIRTQQGVVTFADMLLTGWELLVRYPDLLTAVQSRYDHVLVDEFQDVNLAQSEILDLITQPHRNYMAIGDDDQTIYEWRGASPKYILDFPKRYDAKTYVMQDNFRCPAAPLVLANKIIVHNKQRYKKQLQLTQGFGGNTAVFHHKDLFEMSNKIVQSVQQRHKSGVPLNDIAVLVRLNAQTPPIEQALIAQNIPYRVSKPFYERLEIKTLIQYGRLAWLERAVQNGERPLTSPTMRDLFEEAWRDVCNRPKRYMNAETRRKVWERAVRMERPLSVILHQFANQAQYGWQQEPLEKMAFDIGWLSKSLDKPAQKILHQLDIRLDYQTYLKQSSGFKQTGEGRAISVSTFIKYARKHGTLTQFLQHIRQLAQQKIGQADGADDMVTLSTIHQAKGLEWPVVIIPQCNHGFLPFVSDRPTDKETEQLELAEERRLFYVALTRTKQDCDLHVIKREKPSRFLREGKQKQVLDDLPKLRDLLQQKSSRWQAADALFVVQTVSRYELSRYFVAWWGETAVTQQQAQTVVQFLQAARQQKLWQPLNLKESDLAFWQSRVPGGGEEVSTTFRGIEKLKKLSIANSQSSIVNEKSPIPNPQSPIPNPRSPIPEPETILPGMWLLCDAGWGQIERIYDLVKRPLPSVPLDNIAYAHFGVTLRPQKDAEPIEIDVSAKLIRFKQKGDIYTCSQCEQFAARSMELVIDWHNSFAHQGVSPRFKRVGETAVKLSTLRFAANYEPCLMLK